MVIIFLHLSCYIGYVLQFLHLLGCDTNGHANKPNSKELLRNIKVLNDRVSRCFKVLNDRLSQCFKVLNDRVSQCFKVLNDRVSRCFKV
jgi:hypothetical protein